MAKIIKPAVKPEVHITDRRMLDVMEYCVKNKINGVTSNKDWCATIDMHSNNIYNIRQGVQMFTKAQIYDTCKLYGIAPDYIFGFSNNMFARQSNLPPLERIVLAVEELQRQQPKKKTK